MKCKVFLINLLNSINEKRGDDDNNGCSGGGDGGGGGGWDDNSSLRVSKKERDGIR